MSVTYHHKVEQRSPEWFQLRCGMVTASTVNRLLTDTLRVANNDTSRAATRTLVAERITGFGEESYTNGDMIRGIEMEPYARDIYSGHYEQAVECGFVVLEEDDWTLGISPDGLIGERGGLEVKCPRQQEHVRTILADEVPSKYMAQIQSSLLVTGREWWDYCSYSSGLPLYVKRVYPDAAWHAAIEAACRQFETNAAALVAEYRAKTKNLPKTERVDLYPEIQVA